MVTNASSRFLRPSLIAAAALAVAVALAPWPMEAQRGGGGHSGGGGRGGGGAPRGGGGGYHGGGGHRGGGGYYGGGGHRGGGGYRGGGWYGGGYRGYRGAGWGYYPYGWGAGWGWAPYYSSWWWGGPNVYVGTGGYGYGDDGLPLGDVGVATRTGRYAVVKTDVSPEEAQIFLDDKYIGSADDFDGMPDFLYLGTGKYHLEFRLPGYQSFATDLDVSRGQRLRLDQKLKLEPGKSALDQFPPASKGTPLGRVFTKGGPEVEEVEPAPRYTQQRQPAPRDDGWSDREGAAPGMDVQVEALPRPASKRARMRFKVTPVDAAVYVDDKYLGAGEDLAANPRGVVTDPGTHSITVTRPGYKSKTVDVTVRIGSPVDVVVELEK